MQKEELEALRKRARRGWVALAVGVGFALFGSFQVGRYVGHRDAAENLRWLAFEQQESTRMLAKAWADQRNGINLVQAAAARIREHDEQVNYNQENQCPDFQKATASRSSQKTMVH